MKPNTFFDSFMQAISLQSQIKSSGKRPSKEAKEYFHRLSRAMLKIPDKEITDVWQAVQRAAKKLDLNGGGLAGSTMRITADSRDIQATPEILPSLADVIKEVRG